MAVHNACALESVADDGEAVRPGGVGAPEDYDAEEDVVVGVQGAVLDQDARVEGDGGGVVRCCGLRGDRSSGEETEVAVCGGEVGVAVGFRDGRLLARWSAVLSSVRHVSLEHWEWCSWRCSDAEKV